MGDDGTLPEKGMEVEDGELAESGGEQSDNEGASKQAEQNRHKKNKSTESSRPGKAIASSDKRKAEALNDRHKPIDPANERRGGKGKKGDRKRNDDGEGRQQSKGKRKATIDANGEASFEDELNAYQNTQRDRRRSREPADNASSRPPSPGRRNRHQRDGHPPRVRQRKEEVRPKEKRVPCKFFLEGRCRAGNDCPFSHNVQQSKKLEACKFYVGGFCQKGPGCVYMHEEFPCKFFHTGQQCYSGDNCKFSHENLSADARMALERFLEKENKGGFDRHQRDRPVSPHDRHSPAGGQGALRTTLLPTPDARGAASEDNSRRRPDFFRETMPDDGRNHGSERNEDYQDQARRPSYDGVLNEPYTKDFPAQDVYQEPLKFHGLGNEFPVQNDLRRADGHSPPGSVHSDGSARDLDRKPKLFARLQHRAQLMKQPGNDEITGQADYRPEREEEDGRLTIVEPATHEPLIVHSQVVSDPWNASDDEDDGGDQLLANSLKRLQEKPERRAERWEQGGRDNFYREQPYDDSATYYPEGELSAEELSNQGKVLLSTPPGGLFQTTIHNPVFPPGGQFENAYARPVFYEQQALHHSHHYEEQNWQAPEHMSYGQQGPYQPYGQPTPMYSPPDVGLLDPRQHRAVSHEMAVRSPTDHGVTFPEPSLPAGGNAQTLEAVMQQLARKFSASVARPVVAVPEIDAALSRNSDPPLYRLEAIHIPKSDSRAIFEKLNLFRTVEELGKDPRVAAMMKALAPVDPEGAKNHQITGTSKLKLEIIPTEPVEPTDPKKASLEFDAFTAMLNKALENSKKREAEEEVGRSSPGKRTLNSKRVATQ